MANNCNMVMDGRDIGSVVLPLSKIKIYMWASPSIRAERRVNQNIKLGIKENYEDVLSKIKQRDYDDIHRKNSPLIQTEDAIRIDTTKKTIEQIVNQIVNLVNQ
jgi:cytidylate kinase